MHGLGASPGKRKSGGAKATGLPQTPKEKEVAFLKSQTWISTTHIPPREPQFLSQESGARKCYFILLILDYRTSSLRNMGLVPGAGGAFGDQKEKGVWQGSVKVVDTRDF